MDPRVQIAEAHAVGRAVTIGRIEQVRAQALVQVRRSMGMTRQPPAPCLDPDRAYIAPDSVVRRIHGDLPAMLIGGLSALLFQMLHPLAMAGVAPDGRPYAATDPDLLTWVHAAEVSSFLAASRVYAPYAPSPEEADDYLD